jgi:signal transduction histidine kinase
MSAARLPQLNLRSPLLVDAGLALVVTLAGLGSVAVDQGAGAPLWPWVLVGAQGLPLVVRRRFPFVVLLVIGTARVAYDVAGYQSAPLPLGPLVALYTVALLAGPTVRTLVPALTLVGLTVGISTNKASRRAFEFLLNLALLSGAWLLGELSRQRRLRADLLIERAERAEANRDALARVAVAEERTRLARELHDVVAHHVSLIAVQAEAAHALLPDRPEEALETVDTIGAHARQTMTELHQLLGVLREEQCSPPMAPQAGLDAISALAASFADAGLTVDVTIEGDRRQVPVALELSAFRIVQEALTNTVRHAQTGRAWVALRWLADELTPSRSKTTAPVHSRREVQLEAMVSSACASAPRSSEEHWTQWQVRAADSWSRPTSLSVLSAGRPRDDPGGDRRRSGPRPSRAPHHPQRPGRHRCGRRSRGRDASGRTGPTACR